MKSRLLVVMISVLMLAAIVPQVKNVSAAKTWYVDDSGSADFTTIGAGVAAANAGDTIIVKNGTYTENVVVDKSLTIQSENGYTTTLVQAVTPVVTTPVIQVTASGVTIDGFTVSGSNLGSLHACGIRVTGDNCTIKNNKCAGNRIGIMVELASGNVVINNTCTSNAYSGIMLNAATANTIADNVCWNNTQIFDVPGVRAGIILFDESDGNTITNNVCDSNNIGMRVKNADSNTIFKNSFLNNNYGMDLYLHPIENLIYLNDFVNSTTQNLLIGYNAIAGNFWNSQTPIKYWFNDVSFIGYMGNHWSNYTGADANGDGIGDTPHPTFNATECDNYPLMEEYTAYSTEPLPSIRLTVVDPNGATTTLNETGICSLPTYSGVGGYFKVSPRIPQWYANYTGVPLSMLGDIVGGVTTNTFVQVLASDGFNCNFSYAQVVNGIVNISSCAYNYNLTTVNLQDVEVPQTQPITMMLAYQFSNGTFLPSNGPLFLTFVGPEGLLTVPTPDLAGGEAWVKNVTTIRICWIGDFDGSHTVDYSDIITFVDAYIAANGQSPVLKQRCDLNVDGSISYDDIIAFVDCYIAANTP